MINKKLIVLRKHNEMTLDELRAHGNNVVDATYKKPDYEGVATEADSVQVRYNEFDAACAAAANGGKSLTEVKQAKRTALLEALDALGTALQLTVKEDLSYITNAQYQYRSQPVKSSEPLPDPTQAYVMAGVLSGTVVGKVADLPKGVKSVAVEYSDDNGLTWKNGTYSTGKKFTLAGLSPRKDYLVRVVYHGTFQRTSNPSKPLPVFVL